MASLRELREEIKEGLQERKSKNRGLNPKRQALMSAIRSQEVEKVDRLLNQGLDPNFRDAAGDYPLHVACSARVDDQSCAERITELLLYMGAEQETYDRFGRWALHVAAANSCGTVRILLDRGCSVNAQDNAGCTALMEACSHNDNDAFETATLLLHHNANVHLRDERGFTALHYVCLNNHFDADAANEMALLLLHAGLSATAADHEGRMALCYELDKVTTLAYRAFPQVSLRLVETLICAGSNLQHNSKTHQYWVRYVANTASPKVLSALLQMFSPVLTRPCLRLINKTVMDLNPEGDDKNSDGTQSLQAQVLQLACSLDSLQSICRRSVRANLRGTLLPGVPQLPLPDKLKRFLTSLDRAPL